MCVKCYQNRRGREYFGIFSDDFTWNDPTFRSVVTLLVDRSDISSDARTPQRPYRIEVFNAGHHPDRHLASLCGGLRAGVESGSEPEAQTSPRFTDIADRVMLNIQILHGYTFRIISNTIKQFTTVT